MGAGSSSTAAALLLAFQHASKNPFDGKPVTGPPRLYFSGDDGSLTVLDLSLKQSASSPDGSRWSKLQPLPVLNSPATALADGQGTNAASLCCGGGVLVVDSAGRVHRSGDGGATWLSGNGPWMHGSGGGGGSRSGATLTTYEPGDATSRYVLYAGGRLPSGACVPDAYYTTDGLSWTRFDPPPLAPSCRLRVAVMGAAGAAQLYALSDSAVWRLAPAPPPAGSRFEYAGALSGPLYASVMSVNINGTAAFASAYPVDAGGGSPLSDGNAPTSLSGRPGDLTRTASASTSRSASASPSTHGGRPPRPSSRLSVSYDLLTWADAGPATGVLPAFDGQVVPLPGAGAGAAAFVGGFELAGHGKQAPQVWVGVPTLSPPATPAPETLQPWQVGLIAGAGGLVVLGACAAVRRRRHTRRFYQLATVDDSEHAPAAVVVGFYPPPAAAAATASEYVPPTLAVN